MKINVLFFLAALGLVSWPAASATVQQQQGEWYKISHAWYESIQSNINLKLRGTVCQQSWVWQGGCTTQHLAKPYHPHSQEVPPGEPRYTKDIYAKFTLTVINVLIYPPTALLLETVQNQLHHLQGQHQLQQDKIDRLLEELATLKNNSMDGMILLFLFVCLFVCFLVCILKCSGGRSIQKWGAEILSS